MRQPRSGPSRRQNAKPAVPLSGAATCRHHGRPQSTGAGKGWPLCPRVIDDMHHRCCSSPATHAPGAPLFAAPPAKGLWRQSRPRCPVTVEHAAIPAERPPLAESAHGTLARGPRLPVAASSQRLTARCTARAHTPLPTPTSHSHLKIAGAAARRCGVIGRTSLRTAPGGARSSRRSASPVPDR